MMNCVPENSNLNESGEICDYGRCYSLRLPFPDLNIEIVAERFKLCFPKWLYRLLGIGILKPLLKNSEEIIFGANLKYLEWRISILNEQLNDSNYHFVFIINYNNIFIQNLLKPWSFIFSMVFKNLLQKLKRSLIIVQRN